MLIQDSTRPKAQWNDFYQGDDASQAKVPSQLIKNHPQRGGFTVTEFVKVCYLKSLNPTDKPIWLPPVPSMLSMLKYSSAETPTLSFNGTK